MNSGLEYILVGIVTLAILIYLLIALLAPEKF
jgi:K+-transporting ATPase KdpF subunit